MKSEIIKENNKTFPCLMELKEEYKNKEGTLIVLFSDERTGVTLKSDYHSVTGISDNNWDITQFKPFKGKLVLSND